MGAQTSSLAPRSLWERPWDNGVKPCQQAFISGAVYEDRLDCQPHTADRVLVGKLPAWPTRPAGLLYAPVEHEGMLRGGCECAKSG